MTQPRRNWDAARQKVIAEGSRCRVCRSGRNVQCAHVIARSHDREIPIRGEGDWKAWDVHPDRIVPLCQHHHGEYDAHRFDLLPWLTVHEAVQAVADAAGPGDNGLENARIRLCPSAYAIPVMA